MFGRRLADDAHEAWNWGSVRFIALGGVCPLTVLTCPPMIAAHVPEFVWQALSCFSVFCTFAAGVARITTKETPDVRNTDAKQPLS